MNFHPMDVNANTRVRWETIKQLSVVQHLRGKKILDVGAGLGYFSYKFSRLRAEVTATDVDSLSLSFLERNFHIKTMLLNVEKDPLPPETYDLIFIGEVLEHVKDPKIVLKKARNALSKDGKILLTTPALEGLFANSPGKKLGHFDGSEKHERDGFYFSELQKMLLDLEMSILKHKYCVFFSSELFMQLTKLVFLLKRKTYSGQSDILKTCKNIPFKFLRLIFPFLLNAFMIEEDICRSLNLSGHCHIILSEKNIDGKPSP